MAGHGAIESTRNQFRAPKQAVNALPFALPEAQPIPRIPRVESPGLPDQVGDPVQHKDSNHGTELPDDAPAALTDGGTRGDSNSAPTRSGHDPATIARSSVCLPQACLRGEARTPMFTVNETTGAVLASLLVFLLAWSGGRASHWSAGRWMPVAVMATYPLAEGVCRILRRNGVTCYPMPAAERLDVQEAHGVVALVPFSQKDHATKVLRHQR